MATILLLDASLVGLAAVNEKKAEVAAFRAWIEAKHADSAYIIAVADVTWYEARRGLLSVRDDVRLKRVDEFCEKYFRLRVPQDAWRVASELWADLRRRGQSVADPKSLDGDAVLAGVARTCGGPGDEVVVVTKNRKHLIRFGINTEAWQDVP